jgi:hypothetical protein
MINADEMRLIMFRYGPAIVALRIRSSGKKQKAKGKRQKAKGKRQKAKVHLNPIHFQTY